MSVNFLIFIKILSKPKEKIAKVIFQLKNMEAVLKIIADC